MLIYYHTIVATMKPEFNAQPIKKKNKLPRYKLLESNEMISFSIRGDSSICVKFH